MKSAKIKDVYGCRLFFFINLNVLGFDLNVLGFDLVVLGFDLNVLGLKKRVLGFEKGVLGFEKRVLGFFSGVSKNVTWQSPRGKVEIGDLKEIKILFIHLRRASRIEAESLRELFKFLLSSLQIDF